MIENELQELRLDELMELLEDNKRKGEKLSAQWSEMKQERTRLTAELRRRRLCLTTDYYSGES